MARESIKTFFPISKEKLLAFSDESNKTDEVFDSITEPDVTFTSKSTIKVGDVEGVARLSYKIMKLSQKASKKSKKKAKQIKKKAKKVFKNYARSHKLSKKSAKSFFKFLWALDKLDVDE